MHIDFENAYETAFSIFSDICGEDEPFLPGPCNGYENNASMHDEDEDSVEMRELQAAHQNILKRSADINKDQKDEKKLWAKLY